MKIQDLLHGCRPDRIQSVGWMQVIPLLSELNDDRFVPPTSAFISTATYGTLVVRNAENKPCLLPSGITYIVDQAAQNHALPHAGYVKGKSTKKYVTAMCVQQTQGGTIKEGQHQMMLLPFPLRERAHKVREECDFRRLWPAIAEFNERAGCIQSSHHIGGHLEYFFNHYKEQLDDFVAQFEPVPNQVGAIVMVGGKVAGIERMPSNAFFLDVWRPLIRECYGALAIMSAKEAKGGIPPLPKTRVAIQSPVPKSRNPFDGLRAALSNAESIEHNRVCDLVDNLLKIDLTSKCDETVDGIRIDAVGEQPFVGQVIRDGEKVLYTSLIATEHWRRNDDWLLAKPFAMARK